MRFIDVLRISMRMLRTNALRSFLTILGIAVAIALIVLLIGLGSGLQNITIGSIIRSKTLLSLDVTQSDRESFALTQDTVAMIQNLPGTKNVSPVITTAGELTINNKIAATAITAATPDYLEMEGIEIKNGEAYGKSDPHIVLSPKVLELLDLNDIDALGAEATLSYSDPNNQNESKQLTGLFVTGISSNTDAVTIYLPYDLLSHNNTAKISAVKVEAADRSSLIAIQEKVTQKGYHVESLIETLDQARTVFRWVTFGLSVFGFIALIVAAIGMFNTLTISLLERTREIGIMKAIGVTDRIVKKLFLAEAGIIGFLGGLLGIIIALLGGNIITLVINQLALRFGGPALPLFQYPPLFLIGMLIFPVLLAVATGLYPSIRASRLNPLRALRYE